MNYTIKYLSDTLEFPPAKDSKIMQEAQVAEISQVREESSVHIPKTIARIFYKDDAIYVNFHVKDRYVKSVHTDYGASVCRDSCVEFFIQPKEDAGYFNFEVNCGGCLHLSYIKDCTRTKDGFKDFSMVDKDIANKIKIYHSMPETVFEEITDPVEWDIALEIPFSVFEYYIGSLTIDEKSHWKGNLYKCADDTSHPHWLTWAPVMGKLNFHKPEYFQTFKFEKRTNK
ncbi:MAG: carbohydrate-binding family 9-like protein [Verrucomicrobiota bacterium]|nr:carbohydrate-binding family 9-like protein [Verrucomicrobiota bacterium]